MADYKVVFRRDNSDSSDQLGWERGCPLLLNAVQISRNIETGACYLQLKLTNVSAESISSFNVIVQIYYDDGEQEFITVNPLDADIRPGAVCTPQAVALSGSSPDNALAQITNVQIGDKIWESQGELYLLPTFSPLALSDQAQIERDKELEEWGVAAERLPWQPMEDTNWWGCSCGGLNVGRDSCHACRFDKLTIYNLSNEDHLIRQAAERKEQKKKTRRHLIIAAITAFVLVVAAICSLLAYAFIIEPELARQAREETRVQEEQEHQEEVKIAEAEQQELQRQKDEFLIADRSCNALESWTETIDHGRAKTLQSTSYLLDAQGNIVGAERSEEDGATHAITVDVNDIGFPLTVSENGSVVSIFEINASNDMGLPVSVTQSAANGTQANYTYEYNAENKLIAFESTINGDTSTHTASTLGGDGKWTLSFGLSALNTPESLINEGYCIHTAASFIPTSEERSDNGLLSEFVYGSYSYNYKYKLIEHASVWADIAAQAFSESAALPYNLWLGLN